MIIEKKVVQMKDKLWGLWQLEGCWVQSVSALNRALAVRGEIKARRARKETGCPGEFWAEQCFMGTAAVHVGDTQRGNMGREEF